MEQLWFLDTLVTVRIPAQAGEGLLFAPYPTLGRNTTGLT